MTEKNALPGVRDAGPAYEVHERESVYAGKLIRVYRERFTLPNDVEAVHEVLRYPEAVAIIPLIEKTPGEPELLLVEQLRNSVGGYIHEIPAGMLEEGEDPLDCARRELEEETGYVAGKWTHVTTLFPTPGVSGVKMYFFLAEDLAPTGSQSLEPTECLSVKAVRLKPLIRSIVSKEDDSDVPRLVDGKTHIAALFLGNRLNLDCSR